MHRTLFVQWHQLRLLVFEFVLAVQFLRFHLTAPVKSNSACNILCCAICCCAMRQFVSEIFSISLEISELFEFTEAVDAFISCSLIDLLFLDFQIFHVLLFCLLCLFLPFVVSTGVNSSWRFHFPLFLLLLLSIVVLVAHYDTSEILFFGSASCYLASLLDSVLWCDHFVCNMYSSP